MFTSNILFPPISSSANEAFVQAAKDNDLEKVQSFCNEKQNIRSYEEACHAAVKNHNLTIFTLLAESYTKEHKIRNIHNIPNYIMVYDALDILVYYLSSKAFYLSQKDLIELAEGNIEYEGRFGSAKKLPLKCINYILSTVDFNQQADVCNSLLYMNLSSKLRGEFEEYHNNPDFIELCKTSYNLALKSANNNVYSLKKFRQSDYDFVTGFICQYL
jgi:hypothetical protein